MTALTGSIGILIAFFLLVKEHLGFQKNHYKNLRALIKDDLVAGQPDEVRPFSGNEFRQVWIV